MQVEIELKRNLTESLIVAGDAEQRMIGALLIQPDAISLDETVFNPSQFTEAW